MRKRDQGWDFLISSDEEIDSDAQFYRNSDGSGTYYGADGSTGYINSDGSGTYYAADGSTGYINSDGSGTYYGKDGSTEYRNSDGSGTYYGKDGSTEYINSDGSRTYYGSNGYSKYYSKYDDVYVVDEDDEEDGVRNEDEDYSSSSTSNDESSGGSLLGAAIGLGLVAMAAHSASKNSRRVSYDEEADVNYSYNTSYRSAGFIDSIKDFFSTVWKWIKRIIICIVIICVLVVGVYVYDSWSTKQKEKIDNRIAIGVSSIEVIGQDYKRVEEQLEDAGFSYVVSYQMYDLDYSERNKEGTIGKIEVDGDETFSSLARYDKDVDIVIEYHSLKNEYPPMTSKEAKKQNYNDVVTQFKNAGFGNIKLVQEKDLITGWITKDGSVESVSINGDVKYKTTSSFRVDAEITITYHTFKDK